MELVKNGNRCFSRLPGFRALPKSTKNESLLNTFIALVSNDDSPEEACVYSDYKNTIEALKEIGVLKSDGSLNEDSCPYKITGGYEYPRKWR